MSHTVIPPHYQSQLNLYDTQGAIGLLKTVFAAKLSQALHLVRVSAPLFVDPRTGLNDNLNGVERPVVFDITATGTAVEIIHSLAKWKRMALYRYGFREGGLYTDMNAIRRDEVLSNLHSVYVDQWDWEMIIGPEERCPAYLKRTVEDIVAIIVDTLAEVKAVYPVLDVHLNPEVSFVTTQELADRYPDLSPREREDIYTKEHKTVFIMEIGGNLRSGQPHDGRAPDYDDWTLNGDILFYHDILGKSFEVSSMGIRVDADAMRRQLIAAGCEDRLTLPFHQMVLDGTLPLTMGGGIGQSRLAMLLLGKAHIGEVQVSVWDQETEECCRAAGIELL